eukprot:2070962-Prymnesium_polylepis.1
MHGEPSGARRAGEPHAHLRGDDGGREHRLAAVGRVLPFDDRRPLRAVVDPRLLLPEQPAAGALLRADARHAHRRRGPRRRRDRLAARPHDRPAAPPGRPAVRLPPAAAEPRAAAAPPADGALRDP